MTQTKNILTSNFLAGLLLAHHRKLGLGADIGLVVLQGHLLLVSGRCSRGRSWKGLDPRRDLDGRTFREACGMGQQQATYPGFPLNPLEQAPRPGATQGDVDL